MSNKKEKTLNIFRILRTAFVKNKVRLQRTLSYLAILNSGMILFLVLSDVEKYNIDINITKWFIPIYAVTLIVFLIIGWLDDYAGLHIEESRIQTSKNPQMTKLLASIEHLEKKIDTLEKHIKPLNKKTKK